jgi:hypothetical protein
MTKRALPDVTWRGIFAKAAMRVIMAATGSFDGRRHWRERKSVGVTWSS